MRFQVGVVVLATALALSPAAHSGEGKINLAWDPVSGATGYRIYYGTQSGQYESYIEVFGTTQAVIDELEACTDYFAAVKAIGPQGESADFSNEIHGWARPTFVPGATAGLQGNQILVEIEGSNFENAAELEIDANAVPLDAGGEPLVVFNSVDVVSCDRIQALLTLEPTARGFQATPTGAISIGLQLRNPDGVFNSGSMQLDVGFNPDRADVNRNHQRTTDRVDGDDLATFARSWASSIGEDSFEFDCDMDGDRDIDGDDLALLASLFGQCRSGSTWSAGACL